MVTSVDRHSVDSEAGPPLRDPYEVASVRTAPAPAGTSGTSWHRYEIRQGSNVIVGYREGALDKVMSAVELIVVQLNERRKDRRGRVHVVLRSRASPATTARGGKKQ